MKTIVQLLIFSSSIFIFSDFTITAQSANSCPPVKCDQINGPEIRFPFRVTNRQPVRCGYPGFDLHCNARNQTILNLPQSGEFVVDFIDYRSPAIFIDDPGSCLPNRSMDFTLSGSPFRASSLSNYTFLNCSDNWAEYSADSRDYVPLFCLSERNSTVLAMDARSTARVPPTCRRMGDVSVPLAWAMPQFYWWSMDLSEDFGLVWTDPDCGECENRGGVCGFEGDSGLRIGCSRRPGRSLPRSAKYAIIVGVGIPALLLAIGLACYYAVRIIKLSGSQNHLNHTLPITTTTFSDDQRRAINGLDGPTIESYPMTVLGESRRLPKLSDGTCPICLSEYQPKETLRSIPDCNHYFHAGCIDEWLKLNGTCPLCRNSPDTSCSSGALSSSSPSTSPEHQ